LDGELVRARVYRKSQALDTMESRKGGSSTPSYSQAVSSRGKKPLETVKGFLGEGKQNNRDTQEQNNSRKEARKEKGVEKNNQNAETKKQNGLCKPKTSITPIVVLSDPALQAHRDHMMTYAIICKVMGLWPTEKALQAWIKNHQNRKGI